MLPGITALLLLVCLANTADAQDPAYRTVSIDEALSIACKNNYSLAAVRLHARAAEQLKRSAFDPAKAQLTADYGHTNSAYQDSRIGLTQAVSFPTVYINQSRVSKAEAQIALENARLNEQELKASVRTLFFDYVSLTRRQELLLYADSLYRLFELKAVKRFETGAANILEKTAAETQRAQISNQLILLEKDRSLLLNQFNFLLRDTLPCRPSVIQDKCAQASLDTTADLSVLPAYQLAVFSTEAAQSRWKLERSKNLPDFFAGYNNQSLSGIQSINGKDISFSPSDRFSYIGGGISIPLFFGAQAARARSAKLSWQGKMNEANEVALQLATHFKNAVLELKQYNRVLEYYEQSGLNGAGTIITTAGRQLQSGEIDYLQWVILVNQAIGIQNEYINTLSNVNRAAIQLTKLNNK